MLSEISAIVTHGGEITGGPNLAASALCAIIRAVTASWACHLILLARSFPDDPLDSRCSSECALEDGFTGLPDVIGDRPPHIGVSATNWTARQASLKTDWTEVYIGLVDTQRLRSAFLIWRRAGFATDPRIWWRLALRQQNKRPPVSELVCSTWAAALLVEVGCLKESRLTWNAAPSDFLLGRLPFQCNNSGGPAAQKSDGSHVG